METNGQNFNIEKCSILTKEAFTNSNKENDMFRINMMKGKTETL